MTADDNVCLWLQHLTGESTNPNEEESLDGRRCLGISHVPTGSGGIGKSRLAPLIPRRITPIHPRGLEHHTD